LVGLLAVIVNLEQFLLQRIGDNRIGRVISQFIQLVNRQRFPDAIGNAKIRLNMLVHRTTILANQPGSRNLIKENQQLVSQGGHGLLHIHLRLNNVGGPCRAWQGDSAAGAALDHWFSRFIS
jgi:hypothetical protein